MSWILKKGSKKHTTSSIVEKEFEKALSTIESLDASCRRIKKCSKSSIEALTELSRKENAVVHGLKKSSLSQTDAELKNAVEVMTASQAALDQTSAQMTTVLTKTAIEPMKRFSIIFPNVQSAVKKREQAKQEVNRCRGKVDKYQAKERTGPNIVKLEQHKKSLSGAKEEFDRQNLRLLKELPSLYDARVDYLQPSVQALCRALLENTSSRLDTYRALSASLSGNQDILSEEEYFKDVEDQLASIKALSIVD